MTFRGVIKNGAVVLEDATQLPEGTVVDVIPVGDENVSLRDLPAFGMWKDRTDLPADPVEAVRVLRERSIQRRTDG